MRCVRVMTSVVAGAIWVVGSGALAAEGIGTVSPGWLHLSSRTGDLEAPSEGQQQTSSAVFDADGDGVNDFVVTERTQGPSVVLYVRQSDGWSRSVLDPEPLGIEAGAAPFDVDSDGDVDFVAGGDYRSNQVWWWENPRPAATVDQAWKRHLIKSSGPKKQHDQMAADVDGDGQVELVFWNQEDATLLLAEIPEDPGNGQTWPLVEIYRYTTDSQPEQRGTFPSWKAVNEHEGLDLGDVDGDGQDDIVGGGLWFKHMGGNVFAAHSIDPGYAFSRSAVGQLKKGGRPEVVLSVGDGEGPLLWYEWVEGTWVSHEVARLSNGHSLDLVDFDGDGDLDVLAKPYNGDAPRIDVLLNEGVNR